MGPLMCHSSRTQNIYAYVGTHQILRRNTSYVSEAYYYYFYYDLVSVTYTNQHLCALGSKHKECYVDNTAVCTAHAAAAVSSVVMCVLVCNRGEENIYQAVQLPLDGRPQQSDRNREHIEYVYIRVY